MKTMISMCGAAMIAAAIATPAAAQVTGVYAGTSADGQNLSFTVGPDPNNGEPALLSAGIAFSAPCRGSTAYVLNTAWGFGLLNDIGANRRVKVISVDNYFYFDFTLVFSADGQSATGTITSISPTLYQLANPPPPKPTQALFCTSPLQTLSLALQPDADKSSVKPNQQSVRRNDESQNVKSDETK